MKFKILSIHTKGTNYEKLKQYSKAHDQFKHGKMVVEQYLGSEDQSYAMFCSAMNGAKLKTKYQTPSNENRRAKSKSRSRSPSDESNKKKKVKTVRSNADLPSLHSRVSSATTRAGRRPYSSAFSKKDTGSNRNRTISTIEIRKSHLSGASRGKNNLLLENAEIWQGKEGDTLARAMYSASERYLNRFSNRNLVGYVKPKSTHTIM